MVFARWRATITDQAGNIVPNASIYVTREIDGSLPQLYSDRDGNASLGNPFVADADGFAFFHVIGGSYRIKASQGGFSQEWRYVGIGTAQELDAGAFGENAGWDAVVQTIAERSVYAGEDVGFRVLVINADGDGRAAVYEKRLAGDTWSNSIWITGVHGADGPANTLTVGDVYESLVPEVVITGQPPSQVINFGIVKGDTGDVTPELIQLRDEAEDARDAAAGSADAASDSAVSAANSASAAAGSEQGVADDAAAAQLAASNAATSESNAASSASTASTQAGNASDSASDAEDSANAADASAATATTQAGIATSAASDASDSAVTAATEAGIATNQASAAEASAVDAGIAQDYAWEWSSNNEDDPVDDGIRQGFSAYHWSKKAEGSAGGGLQSVVAGDGISVDNADLLNPSVGLNAASQASLELADSALQELVEGANIEITGSGTTRTISATSAPQVNADWNATSGVAEILNRPGIVTDTTDGLMSAGDKTKLDDIEAGAQVNTLTSVAGRTGDVTLTKEDVGLYDVENIAPEDMPVSTAQAAADALRVTKLADTGIGGFTSVRAQLGDLSGQIIVPDTTVSNFQFGTNNGAWQLDPPLSGDTAYSISIRVYNAVGAGPVTIGAYSNSDYGDFDPTVGLNHYFDIVVNGSLRELFIRKVEV